MILGIFFIVTDVVIPFKQWCWKRRTLRISWGTNWCVIQFLFTSSNVIYISRLFITETFIFIVVEKINIIIIIIIIVFEAWRRTKFKGVSTIERYWLNFLSPIKIFVRGGSIHISISQWNDVTILVLNVTRGNVLLSHWLCYESHR